MELISTIFSPVSRRVSASRSDDNRIFLRLELEVLPHVSQMICGGVSNLSIRNTKSLSFVSTIAFSFRAAKNISSSSASRRPTSLRGAAITGKLSFIQTDMAGGSWASIQIIMLQRGEPDDLISLPHIAARHVYPRPQGLAFLRGCLLSIIPPQTGQARR